MGSLNEIAQELNKLNKNIVLIYALNSTGKTRLSVAYKDFTKTNNKGKHAGVYYNAYSEDLFVWDNDEDNDNANLKLRVLPSSLSQFHSFFIEDDKLIKEKLELYHPKYNFKINPHANLEKGIESITFLLMKNTNSQSKYPEEKNVFLYGAFFWLYLK